MESKLLSAIVFDRNAYEEVKNHVQEADFSTQGYILYKEFADFYEADSSARLIDKDIITEVINNKYEKHANRFKAILADLEPVSIPNVIRALLDLKRSKAALELSHALAGGNEKEIEDKLETYNKLMTASSEEEETSTFIGASLGNILEQVSPENLIKVYPKDLNQRLDGGVPPGTHMLVFARPEAGKSLFSINMACGFLREGRRVLYVGNEDPYAMMLLRFFSNLSGATKHEIQANPSAAEEKAKNHGYDNLIFANLAPGTIKEIRGLIRKFQPNVVIIDQLPNLYAGSLTKVEKLEHLATEARSLAKENNLVVVSVCQAADSAQGKLVLDMGDVYFSNTGIPAQVDVMIGIGTDAANEAQDTRVVSLCKNKLSGNHESFPIRVNRGLSRAISL